MKVQRDESEDRPVTKKGYQRTNPCCEDKPPEENKGEEGDVSNCGIEPSTTALIPPWLRNSLGLAEKGDGKPNQKCLKIYCATNDRPQGVETGEVKADGEGDCLKCHFYIQDSPSTNPILEVNIGSEADFRRDSAENLFPWKSKSGRHNQYECSVFGISKDRELPRSVKSEVTSIDVVVPTEDQDEEKRKLRPHKGKTRVRRRNSSVGFKSEDNLKSDGDTISRGGFPDESFKVEPPLNAKHLDERLLLLCGKKTVDNITQEDVALLQEMKNQIGHKEGFEKLFNDIRDSAFVDKGTKKREEKEYRREAVKVCDKTACFLCLSEDNRTANKLIEDDRKYLDDIRKHHEKKNRKQMKYIDEPEMEKDKKWKGSGQKTHGEKEKKSKLRHSDYSVIEKVVSETLQKFIDLYRVQVPPDVINSMKKNIIQTLHNENQETNGSKRGLDAVLAVQDQLRNAGVIKCSMHHLLTDEAYKTEENGGKHVDFTSEENVVSKDIPTDSTGKTETLHILHKDFEKCLELIRNQMDMTGTRLYSLILEKTGTDDQKLRIVHNFANGLTESIKMYDRANKGSPEGDSVNTAVCECQQTIQKTKRSQWSQTREKTYGKVSTQTDWVDISVKHLRSADLTPGLYRITKATESGRFFLTPEILDEEDDLDEDNDVKRVASEICVKQDNPVLENPVLKYISKETFVSERGTGNAGGNKALWRAFRSDCLGLNNMNSDELTKTLTGNDDKKEQRVEELVEIEVEEEMDAETRRDVVEEKAKDEDTQEDNPADPEGSHKGCVWLWNGKKMSPGIDLKVHVEDLLREKLNEMLNESTNTTENDTSAKNLEIRKTRAKFCITKQDDAMLDSSPFIFRAFDPNNPNLNGTNEPKFREVGTQNSEHSIVSLNISKTKPRSKLCTVAKFGKRRQLNKLRSTISRTLPFAESVGEAKKVKLEFREDKEIALSREKGSNSDSVRECFSIISNGSSSSTDSPVRVKLIGIEVSKEKAPGDYTSAKSSETKASVTEGCQTRKDEEKKYRHWELIENVLNRVSQKEKDILWNDIRDFVKKKIGRDINDEGAREVCIEIEQDVPKFAKDKASRMVVAKGNYTRTEGDVEVEVDLTLDDLERILRHRQKKMRRRMHTHSHKTESKESSTSSDTITECETFKCRPFLHDNST